MTFNRVILLLLVLALAYYLFFYDSSGKNSYTPISPEPEPKNPQPKNPLGGGVGGGGGGGEERELNVRMKGQDVKNLQALLNKEGYKGQDGKPLKVDGDYFTNTKFAHENAMKDAVITSRKYSALKNAVHLKNMGLG